MRGRKRRLIHGCFLSLENVRLLRQTALLFYGRCALLPQARISLLTNLKTHLIIKVSKHQVVDGKPETYGGAYEDWLCARLQTGATRGTSDRCAQRSRLLQIVYSQNDQ